MIDTIKLMKQRVLDMAIRGELVEQRLEEGTAHELLAQIEEEKEKLIKEKAIKKEKKLPKIAEEIPFDIPASWEWVRLGDISAKIHYGYTASASSEGNAKMVRITDIQNGEVNWEDVPYCQIIEKNVEQYSLNEKDIVIARTGGTVGKSYIIKDIPTQSVFASYLIRVILVNKHNAEYVANYLQSSFYWNQIAEKSQGTGQPNVNAGQLKKMIVPLPPLLEQKRIVAKIEALFSVIDKIAEQKEDALQTIELIRQTILQEAIQGNLVEQNENDEPASELIKRIETKKNELIKEKKIKKEKKIPKITGEEKPFDIPKSWEWVRLGSMIQLISGRDLKASEYNDVGEGIPYFTGASNFLNGEVIINRWTTAPKVVSEKGDLLITVKGTIGEMAVQSIEEAHIARQIMAIRNIYELNLKYIQYFIYSRIVELQTKAKSMIPGISRDDILSFEFPLPPIQEQKRIVEKVEKIMHICNSMEKILKGSLEEVVMTS